MPPPPPLSILILSGWMFGPDPCPPLLEEAGTKVGGGPFGFCPLISGGNGRKPLGGPPGPFGGKGAIEIELVSYVTMGE